nr:SGNH/GDSL hydrolase family protein [uncultured Actinoplanes sp.]
MLGGVTGALAGVTALSAGLLLRQAADARRIIPLAEAPPPRGDGLYGAKFPGKPISMVILGDSSAAGYGVHRPRETPGALLATGVSRRLSRPVRLHRLAVVGSMSSGLPYQVDAALEHAPDVAIILIGANDVTHISDRPAAVRHLADAVRRLRATGCRVVVGTCPDIGAIQPIKPPLRWLARKWSRELAAAQTVAVVEAGGRTVSLGNLLGPMFEADPVRMFSSDQFHPSAEGYARAAAVVLPTLLAVLGEDDRPALTGTEGVRSLEEAAQEAVRAAGTEVSPTRVDGRERGPAGRWAVLRRHPWFGEPRFWFGHRPAAPSAPATTIPSGRSAAGAVGWTPEDH